MSVQLHLPEPESQSDRAIRLALGWAAADRKVAELEERLRNARAYVQAEMAADRHDRVDRHDWCDLLELLGGTPPPPQEGV